MIPLIIAAAVLLVAGAAGVHAMQVAREMLAQRRQRAADARAAERAAQESAGAAEDMRRTRNPWHYISVQRSRIHRLLAPIRERLRQRNAELEQLRTDLADAAPGGSLWRQLLVGSFLVLLAVLFALSVSQLVPSFHVLADPQAGKPTPLDWVLGLLMPAVEIFVAFAVAYALRPEKGWKPFAPKVYAALALLLAGVLIYGQLQWAPLHDTIPLRSQLATAQETLVLDQQNNEPQIDVTADRQQISEIQDRLTRVTTRDQAMAFAVTLGSDLAAFPALIAVGFIGAARRRRRLRRRVTAVKSEIGALEQQIVEIPVQITYETQETLARLGINPDYALGPAVTAAPVPLALPASSAPADPAPAPEPAPVNHAVPEGRTLTPEDLFRPGPADQTDPSEAADVDDDRRWTDPL